MLFFFLFFAVSVAEWLAKRMVNMCCLCFCGVSDWFFSSSNFFNCVIVNTPSVFCRFLTPSLGLFILVLLLRNVTYFPFLKNIQVQVRFDQ